MAVRDSVLVTGAYGLVGRPVVERLRGRRLPGHRHRAPDSQTVAACRGGRAIGRSHEAGSGQRCTRRCVAICGRSSGGVHSADVLRQRRVGTGGQRRRDLGTCARRGGDARTPSLRPRIQHGGVRQPQPTPIHRPAHPETPPLASELYGCHKLEAENIVRASALEWSILRLVRCPQPGTPDRLR